MLFLSAVLTDPQLSGRDDGLASVDEQMLSDIAAGDKEAFRLFYENTRRSIYAYALSLTKNADDAKDAMQQTYLKIRANAGSYRPQGKPAAWIITVAKNECRMLLRAGSRRKARTAEMSEAEGITDVSHIKNATDRIALETALEILSEQERTIVFLYAVSGMKHTEISEITGINYSTVLSKYNRAVKKLRDKLQTEENYGR